GPLGMLGGVVIA
nr:Chain 0, peptide self-assembled antimicrobial fibrils [Homo sapiens]8GZ8_1 Chain 1, peptide self-assembled antimicrobial fibrils [Homo sapiens]8GZ8_A Chain A, peptide self-assembled antimicrobial fibrils [Homo sapiens]8GZ8_B Chain B, peptide self-assembled antimicrobial fibrils [Homo sapiens]8GZ8_C Chain C, peptide self-assembled antimicrobial fibrils [Homo sapiens]8GZ8_D Chain D, peptide self-assembled antimicrobial fibrils [Homo sapiens]8GZ8_E Chain E, peptide self-assembled antimicrobia